VQALTREGLWARDHRANGRRTVYEYVTACRERSQKNSESFGRVGGLPSVVARRVIADAGRIFLVVEMRSACAPEFCGDDIDARYVLVLKPRSRHTASSTFLLPPANCTR